GAVVIPQGRRRHWRPGRLTASPPLIGAPEADSGADRTGRRSHPPPPKASPPPEAPVSPEPHPQPTSHLGAAAGAEAQPHPGTGQPPADVPSPAEPGQAAMHQPPQPLPSATPPAAPRSPGARHRRRRK